MQSQPAKFVWYELVTTDTKAAAAFYGSVVGWAFHETDMTGTPYTMLMAGESAVGGLMTLPEEVKAAGGRAAWIGYIAVADVDAAAEQVTARGGKLHRPPEDIPMVGRFAVVADPQGAAFVLFCSSREAPAPAPLGTPGRIAWHELMAQDWPSAFDFYAELCGWEKGDPIEMGPMGTYQIFTANGQMLGGMFNKPPFVPAPFWLFYFEVEDITAATQRVTRAGGTVFHGPTEVPGGSWIVQAMDPQGVIFALNGPKA